MVTTPVTIVAMVAVMPMTMGDLLQFDLVVPFENSGIRLVQLIENSGALRNTGNRAARPGHARKRRGPRNAKHSSKKQPTFHKKPPELLTIDTAIPRPKQAPARMPIGLNAPRLFSFHHPTSRRMKSCSILAAGDSTRFLTVIRL